MRPVDGRGGPEVHRLGRVDPPLLLVVPLPEGDVAVPRREDEVERRVIGLDAVLPANPGVAGVVVRPEEAGGPERRRVVLRPPELPAVRAEEEDRPLVRLHVRDRPVVRVHPVVLLAEDPRHVVDRGGVLRRLPDPVALGRPLGVPRRLRHRRLADHDPGPVHVEVGPRVDAAREGLVDEPVPLGRDDVDEDVEVDPRVARPHEDLAEDDAPVLRRGARRHEGGALVGPVGDLQLVLGRQEAAPRQGVRRRPQRARHLSDVDGGVERHDVEEVDGAAVDLRPRLRRAVRDPLHLRQVLLVVLAEEQRVRQEPQPRPAARPGPSASSATPSFRAYSAISSARRVPYWKPRGYGSPSTWTKIHPFSS